jgi:hypothetical protein
MSSMSRIGRPGAGYGEPSLSGQAPLHGRPNSHFTSWRTATASMCILAVVVVLLVLDLVVPLLV